MKGATKAEEKNQKILREGAGRGKGTIHTTDTAARVARRVSKEMAEKLGKTWAPGMRCLISLKRGAAGKKGWVCWEKENSGRTEFDYAKEISAESAKTILEQKRNWNSRREWMGGGRDVKGEEKLRKWEKGSK